MKLRTFEKLWHRFNDEHFEGAMLPPKFRRTRSNDYWACYENDPQDGFQRESSPDCPKALRVDLLILASVKKVDRPHPIYPELPRY